MQNFDYNQILKSSSFDDFISNGDFNNFQTNPYNNSYTAKFASIVGVMDFVQGIANGTTVANTPNYTLCYNSIQSLVYRVNISLSQFTTNSSLYQYMVALQSALEVPYYIYDINYGCYYGF